MPNKNKMNILVIIQARMGSTRLPGKVLKEIKGKTILQLIIERVNAACYGKNILVATSISERDKQILDFCRKNNIKFFAGSEEDVLDRFLKASEKAKADVVVRVTADCPLVDPQMLDYAVKEQLDLNADYTIVDGLPNGLACEVMSLAAIKTAALMAKERYQREHVMPFMTENPQLFKIVMLTPPKELQRPELRLSVDTPEDLTVIEKIYERLYDGIHIIDSREVIKLIDSDTSLMKINEHIRQKALNE
jgi:spore coat polysaccharide biosynthesis protein SpsF